MTVIRPNAIAGINSITIASGAALAVHKADGTLIQTLSGTAGVSTFTSISVGSATTSNSAAKSINIGLGASIAQHNDNTLTLGTNGDPRITIDASGNFNVGSAATIKAGGNATFSGIVTATSFKGDGSGLSGITGTTINSNADNRVITGSDSANTLNGESNLIFDGSSIGISTTPETDGQPGSIYFAGGNANIWGSGNANLYKVVNARYTGAGGWKYNNTGSASYIAQQSGTWEFRNAPSGTAEATATFTTRVQIDADGDVTPGTNNTQDLGSSSLRWAIVYTNDLNLSNKGSTNSVDGTWGSYTIQEGENDLFLINKRNGKKYKFNLTEVS